MYGTDERRGGIDASSFQELCRHNATERLRETLEEPDRVETGRGVRTYHLPRGLWHVLGYRQSVRTLAYSAITCSPLI